MESRLLLAADYATVDASGKLNILGAFRTIYATQFPAIHQLMHLVIQLRPELGEYGDTRTLRVVLIDEDGKKELLNLSRDFQTPSSDRGKRPDLNFVIGLRDLVFPAPGTYKFRIYIDKEQKDSLSIDVEQIEQPEG